jgi:hypothetical protein
MANVLEKTELVKCKTVDLEVPADCEFVLEGRITGEKATEGPFLDLTGVVDRVRQQPVIEIKCVTHRNNPIYQTILAGKNEHKFLMGMPKEPTIFNEVNKVCQCRDVYITPGGCSWLHAVVQIHKQNADDGKKAIMAAFEGHKSLKHVVVWIAALVLTAGASWGQQGAAPLKNDDVIQMVGAGLGDDAVIDLIQSSSTQFDLSTSSLVALKRAKVSGKVIAAMRGSEAANVAAAKASPASAKSVAATVPASAPPWSPAAGAPPAILQQASSQTAVATTQGPQPPTVVLLSGGNSLPLQPAMAQAAQVNAPGMGTLGSAFNVNSLEKLAMSNMNFMAISSKALMFVPQVAIATKVFSALHHASKPPAVTVAYALPGSHAAVTAPVGSLALDVQYGSVPNLNSDEYEPALVKLTPSKDNWRLLGARQILQQPIGGQQQGTIVEKKIEIKSTRLDHGHVRIEPAAQLPPGEYAVVLRPLNNQKSQVAESPAPQENAQIEYLGWDFSVPSAPGPSSKSQ